MALKMEGNIFTSIFVGEIQIIGYELFEQECELDVFGGSVREGKVCRSFHVLVVDAGCAFNLSRCTSGIQTDVLVVVAVVVDAVNVSRHDAGREGMGLGKIHGKVKVERSSSQLVIVLQVAEVDAVTLDGGLEEMGVIVSQLVLSLSNTAREMSV